MRHIIYKHGQIWKVNCPCCGTTIRHMIPDDSMSVSEHANGKVVVRERLVLACLPNYREVLMQMDDGSKHVAPMCAQCVDEDGALEKACAADAEVIGNRRPLKKIRDAALITE